MRLRARKTGLSTPPRSFPTDRSKAVPLLQFFFVCVSVFHMWCLLCPYMPLISPSFAVSVGVGVGGASYKNKPIQNILKILPRNNENFR